MTKKFYLLVLTVLMAGCTTNNITTNNQDPNRVDDDFYCEKDSDCVPFIYECGSCSNYSIAINRKFYDKYSQKYDDKCGDNLRFCDALPSGSSACENNKCILIK